MSPDDWREIEELFELAADMPREKREALLEDRCAGKPELRAEVERLLNSSDAAGAFMETPVWTDSGFLTSAVKNVLSTSLENVSGLNADLTGSVLGPYRLVSEIGRGGMGAVYRADRVDGEFSQEVAIKLLKRGLDSDFVIKRFRHERQILASFEHPFISRLLDGGTTAEGTPYFVMEYIRGGVTIYDWCDKRKLDIDARLKLFLKVCSALEYAHDRKIIHRDIKPGNILVNPSGAPKLLDFGIAKILDPDLIHESFHPTASVIRMMTPDYASPEQIRGLEITTATDVYSLGVLLFELLTGHRPYDPKQGGIQELSRVICEIEPDAPSKAVLKNSTLLDRYASTSELIECRNAITLEELSRKLSGDIDLIVRKALEKEPSHRWAGVKEFGDAILEHIRTPDASRSNDHGERADRSSIRSVAILPFKTIRLTAGVDTTDENFFGVGLADSLISRLGRIHKFLVRPTSSIVGFLDGDADPIRAGRLLNVDYVLDGNIKITKDKLRLSVQLLDVKSNSAIWATSIDEKHGEFFAIEETLSNQLIEILVPRLSTVEVASFIRRGTESPEAFENYLRGRYHFGSMTEDGLAKSFVLFHKAVAADANYAHAYCGIANYYNWLGVIGVLPPSECFVPALEAAKTAVRLDPNLSEAHASLGFSLHVGEFEWADAEMHFRRAIELNPHNANAYLWYSTFLFMSGRFEKGFEYAERAVVLDPLSPYSHYNIGSGLYYARRFDDAEAQHRKVIEEFPDYGLGYYGLSKIHRYLGETKLAIKNNEKAYELLDGSTLVQISQAECLAADGQHEAAREALAGLEQLKNTRFVSPYMLALAYTFLNDLEAVQYNLDESLKAGEAWLCCAPVEARFEKIFNEPRFQQMLESIDHPLRINRRSTVGRETSTTRGFSDLTTILIESDS
jgi:serine/threonine protein kinase/tetratricopeptide (TPR) repeat protein